MFHKVLRLSFVSVMVIVLLTALLPAAPVSANPASFEFVSVLEASCKPGSFPSFMFNYATGANEVVNHVWTLTNERTGTTTGPWIVGPISPGSFTNVTTVANTPVPDDTLEGDTLTETVKVVNLRGGVVAISEISYYCAGAGCELPIPATAVVGSFLDNTQTYWQPGYLTSPLVVIEVGKTAWTLGIDATGQYRKIIWVCQYLWVPIGSMGPNFDAVWNGTPLPVGVVE